MVMILQTRAVDIQLKYLKGKKSKISFERFYRQLFQQRSESYSELKPRLIRSFIIPALENNILWHERDISHSSVERIIFPDATISLYYILTKTIELVKNLIVYPENMQKNLGLTNGLIYSQKVMLELMKKGMKRQEAYKLVQRCSLQAWEKKINFYNVLLQEPEILKFLTPEEIKQLFSFQNIYKSVDYIFNRLGIE